MGGPPLSLLRCHENCLNIEAIFGGQILADTPDFLDNRIVEHVLFWHEFFGCDLRRLSRLFEGWMNKPPGKAASWQECPPYEPSSSTNGTVRTRRS